MQAMSEQKNQLAPAPPEEMAEIHVAGKTLEKPAGWTWRITITLKRKGRPDKVAVVDAPRFFETDARAEQDLRRAARIAYHAGTENKPRVVSVMQPWEHGGEL